MNRAFLIAAVVAALAAVFFFRPHATPGPPMRDFEAYYAAVAAANAGADPYSVGIWRFERAVDPAGPRFALLPFVSPPFLIPVFRAFALMPFAAANTVWRTLLLACIAALVLCLLHLCGRKITLETFLAAACLAIGFGPLTSALALGQLALVAFASATVAFAWPPAAAAAWVQPNVALTLFSRPPRLVLIWTLAGALLFVVPLTAPYLQTLALHSLSERFSAIQLTPEAMLYGLGVPEIPAAAAGIFIAVCAFAFWVILMRACRSPVVRFAAGCALLPLGMPFFHEHDFIVTFVPAVFVALLCTERMWPIAIGAAVLCGVDWLGLAQRPDGIAQSALLCFTFISATIAIRDDLPAREIARGFAVAVLLFVPAAAIAMRDVLPVWPDGMHALAQTSFTSAAAAWHAEQAATGLFEPNAGWSALRVLPAGGALLLALLLARHVDVLHVVERRDAVGMEAA